MKIKKTFAVLLAAAMVALTACTEQGVDNNTPTGAETTTTTEATTTAERTTTAAATTAAPQSSVNVPFQTYTYRMKDAQNYEYEITLTISPWILDTQSDVLDSAWAKVGKGKTKPAINNMGAQKYANNVYTTQLSDSQGRNRTFYATMTNMYFSVGTVSVKNVTSGWDFSASKPGTPKIALNWVSDLTRGQNSGNYALMTKTFYSSTQNADIGELYAKPKMTKNTWGPVTVVLAHAENISPKYPNGQYAGFVKSGYLLADWAVNETKITIPMYGSSSPASTTQAQATGKSETTSKKADNTTLRVENGAFYIDDSILGMTYEQVNAYFGGNIPKTEAWEWDKWYDSYCDYSFQGKQYTFFFTNNVLKGVRYEITSNSISTSLLNTYKSKYGTYKNRTYDNGALIPKGESGYGYRFTTAKGYLDVFENPYDNVSHIAMHYGI